MNARNAGSGESSAVARSRATLTMSPIVSRSRSKRTVRRAPATGSAIVPPRSRFGPEVIEIEPLERRLETIVLQSRRVRARERGERGRTIPPREVDPVAEELIMHMILRSAPQTEHQI